MTFKYTPKGVCSKQFIIDAQDDIIKSVKILGGCPGNTVAVSRLLEGMKIEDAIKKLKGIRCGYKESSCPDQIAVALEEYLKTTEK